MTIFNTKKNKFSKQEIEKLINNLRYTLLEFDLPYQYVKSLTTDLELKIDRINASNVVKVDKSAFVENFLQSKINETFSKNLDKKISFNDKETTTIGIFGPNGAGKTSFVAKIANLLQYTHKKRVICVSFDFTRFSAQEQLQLLCKKNNIDFFPIVKNGIENGIRKIVEIVNYNIVDVVIVDFAGTTLNSNEKIKQWRQLTKLINFDERIVVLDGTYGQNAINIIKSFNSFLDITGFAVSKIDSSQKGGVFFAIRTASNKPIYYISNGEKINDISEFNSEALISGIFKEKQIRIIVSSMEKKNNKRDSKKNRNKNNNTCNDDNIDDTVIYKKKRNIDFNDLLNILKKIVTSGKYKKLISILPHKKTLFGKKFTTDTYNTIRQWTAIILSMTKHERANINCIDRERIKRIADGAGVSINSVNSLLDKMPDINTLLFK